MLYSRHEREVKGKMKNIYDNGTVMLGQVKQIKAYTENQFKKELIEDYEREEILEELKELKDNDIVAINYDCGMGLSIEYWEIGDIINEENNI